MTHNHFDEEYYVMSVDGANNHPLLAWGKTRKAPFLRAEIIDENSLNLPLKVVFGEPYPKEPYEIPDFLSLGAQYAGSEMLKKRFENIYGIQFISAEIESHKGEIIGQYYAVHFWNSLPAIDKNNYVGEEPNGFGNILSLKRFSLDSKILDSVPLENRSVFSLAEKTV